MTTKQAVEQAVEGKPDTEITLGTAKLLGIFFVLVAICAVFFTMGYLLGRSSPSMAASTTVVSTVPGGNNNPANKPSANAAKVTQAAQENKTSDASTSSNPPVQLTVPPPASKPLDESSPSVNPDAKAAANGASYMVQVAAVTRQEDAEILVSALRKKQYPVFLVANLPGDALFHVQVGPFADPKDAEAMRNRLVADGYNAIVKK